jgi:hypothetical protein
MVKAPKIMKFNPTLIVLVFFVLIVAACGPEQQLRNDSYLHDLSLKTGDPCEAPCWNNITPGETTWNDALAMIEDDPAWEQVQTQADEEGSQIGAAWAQADGAGCCQMFTQEGDVVSMIAVQIAPEISFSEIREKYGPPEYLVGETVTDDQGYFIMFYPEVPMFAYVFIEGDGGALTPESEVIGFGYTTPEIMELMIQTNNLHVWEGYQEYEDYDNSEFEVTPSITLTPSSNE